MADSDNIVNRIKDLVSPSQNNIVQENNAAVSGLNMDLTLNQVKKGELTYALNAAVENFDAQGVNYQNEPGNDLCLNFPEGYQLIGTHFINEKAKHIFFLTHPETGDSEIGYMDNNDCIYRKYVGGKCLNFNVKYPIHKVVHKITNCTTEIYWTDGFNPRRYLDIENISSSLKIKPGTDVCDNETIDELDCNKLKVQPDFAIPTLNVKEITNTGNLIAGTYQFAIQYCDVNGNPYTSYYSVTNPTPISNPLLTTVDFNYPVGKAIVLEINNIDTTGNFQHFNLAVIKTVNSVTSVELVGTYFIDDSNRVVTYTGQNQAQIRLTIDDIFEKFPYYDIAQDITAVQDVLVWDNLTTVDRINYQKVANQIPLQWQTYKLPADEDYADELNATNLRGYLRDEVYAFEIVFLLKNGKQTDGFHIPGRPKNYLELSQGDVPETNPDFIGTPDYYDPSTGVGYSPYWKIYNTATPIGVGSGEKIGSATPHEYGDFAYWESTELYPCNEEIWGELSNTPIRHHKFPDVRVSPLFENPPFNYNPDGTYIVQTTDNAIYPIGVKVDVNRILSIIQTSTLTQEQKENIAGFKIVRGDRSANKSIVAKGILRNVGKYKREEEEYYFPNYPYNDLRKDPFLLSSSNAYQDTCNCYSILPSSNTTVTYTNCATGDPVTENLTIANAIEVCSVSYPTVPTGTATIKQLSYSTYRVACNNQENCFVTITPPGGVAGFITASYLGTLVDSETYPVQPFGSLTIQTSISVEWVKTNNNKCAPVEMDGFSNTDAPFRYVFNSPETSFGTPFLGNVLKIENVVFGAGRGHHVKVDDHANYRLITREAQQDALESSYKIASITATFSASAMFTAYQAYLTIYINGITRKNYTYSYNSIAKYNYWENVDNNIGVKQRNLDLYQYLESGVQNIGETININNWNRESSIYLRTDINKASLPYAPLTPNLLIGGITPKITDDSRYTISERNLCTTPEKQSDIKVVSYYGSIKTNFINQWGQMYSYQTIDTGYQYIIGTGAPVDITVFGGDTFISKFAFKTKLPFFIDNRVGAPDDSDIFYDEIGNIAYPKYWYSARSVLSDFRAPTNPQNTELNNVVSVKAHYLDCPNSQIPKPNPDPAPNPTAPNQPFPAGTPPIVNPGRTFYDGKMYLFAYGIPYFYCESSVNVDLRQAFNNKEGDFWPHVSSGIPDDWVQESNVPISLDNTYYYNITYSKQNEENFFSHLPIDWQDQLCYTNFPFRAIYSERQQSFSDNRINSWLIYRPISFFDFPQNYGKLTSLDGIQNRAVLARFENKSLLYNTLLTIDTSNPQAAYLGNDSLFRSSPPIDFAETDLGYVGCQNKMLLKIPQGQVTVDAKRGQIFLVTGNGVTDLTALGSGVNRFMTDHLAFEILRYFPNANVDNHFNGLGLHGVYDSKYDRVIITKLDYIPLSNEIKYDAENREFYIESPYRQVVYLTDLTYFCNKSWTISYNFNTQSWISFHSYLPNWYIGENNFFYSGLNESCDIEAVVYEDIPEPTTTTTTTVKDCNLGGSATLSDCRLSGIATFSIPTTTSTSTSSSSTTNFVPPPSTSTTTSTSTSTSTTSSTTTIPPCKCYTLTNTSIDIVPTVVKFCGSSINTPINVAGSGSINLCLAEDPAETEFITWVECGNNCDTNDDCEDCAPTTTSTTSSTSSTTSTTSSTSTSTSTTSTTTTAIPTTTTTTSSTSTSTSTSTTSTTTTQAPCNCYSLVNNTNENQSFTVRYCGDAGFTSIFIGPFGETTLCLAQAPTSTAFVTVHPCGVICTSQNCVSCAPTTTTTTSTSTSSTSTTSTTTSTSSSTSTSTSTSTTSTTTTSVPCTCYTITNEGSTNSVQYTNCAGNVITESVPAGTTVYRCTRNTPVALGGTFTIFECNPVVNCTANVQCFDCGATPTTSSTTTAID